MSFVVQAFLTSRFAGLGGLSFFRLDQGLLQHFLKPQSHILPVAKLAPALVTEKHQSAFLAYPVA